MPDINLTVISPDQLDGRGEVGQYDVSRFQKKYLAQGDSWFSLGHFPFWATTNLLLQMTLSRASLAVNCARPGVTLAHMVDGVRAPKFVSLLKGATAWKWDGLLISGGGDDLIDAVGSPPSAPIDKRLLLHAAEWGPQADASRYVSVPGWATFENHMNGVLEHLLGLRDAGINANIPVYLHTYDYMTPRDAPAGPTMGPWLCPALRAFGIPPDDWNNVADHFIESLAAMWQNLLATHAGQNVNVIDTRATVMRADRDTDGVSNDWENEIHPTPQGYTRLAARWRVVLDAVP